eukprot:7378421-Prymnesium_polylepis.1
MRCGGTGVPSAASAASMTTRPDSSRFFEQVMLLSTTMRPLPGKSTVAGRWSARTARKAAASAS